MNTHAFPIILECIRSRSSLSMTVYDRGERLFTVQGCGFDRIGSALDRFLMANFYPELLAFARMAKRHHNAGAGGFYSLDGFYGFYYHPSTDGHGGEGTDLDGACGFEAMQSVAQAINLKVTRSESKAGTLIVIERGSK